MMSCSFICWHGRVHDWKDNQDLAGEVYTRGTSPHAQAPVVESHKADQSMTNLVVPVHMDAAFGRMYVSPGLY